MNEIIRDIKTKHEHYVLRIRELERSIKSNREASTLSQRTIDNLKKKQIQCEEAITALEKI